MTFYIDEIVDPSSGNNQDLWTINISVDVDEEGMLHQNCIQIHAGSKEIVKERANKIVIALNKKHTISSSTGDYERAMQGV